MKALREYIINFGNLKPGTHTYEFTVDERFFAVFDYSLVKSGKVEVLLTLEKQRETFFTMYFDLKGYIDIECDRCLDIFQYPVDSQHRILVKLDSKETESNDELIFLDTEAYEIDVSPFIYEFLNLSLPLRRVCESAGKSCNPNMLDQLDRWEHGEDNAEDDPRWSALKNIKKDQEEN